MNQNKYRVLVTGSRDWPDRWIVYRALDHAYCEATSMGKTMTLVEGACPTGADAHSVDWATRMIALGFYVEIESHPADWDTFKKAAGFRRNAEMVESGVDLCLSFIYNSSKGASHTTNLAKKAEIPTLVFKELD